MTKPIYANETTLFTIALIVSIIAWLGLLLASFGSILLVIPLLFIAYLFAQSALICYLKGNGALVSDQQFPDIQARVQSCAEKIRLSVRPEVYILHGNGMFNAFATKFLRRHYIILLSDTLDALDDHPEAINFYIGHEMGHIDRNHIFWQPILLPGMSLPLLGAAYSRAREYTADMYGALCCSPEAAQQGLAALAVGGKRYKTMDVQAYLGQIHETSGFWMSFHELIGNYPWLIKRFLRISPEFSNNKVPMRNVFAYLPALLVPRLSIASGLAIYFIIAGIAVGGFLKGEELLDRAKTRSSKVQKTMIEQKASSSAGFEIGQLYEKQGKQFRYLGGDPYAADSWKAEEEQPPAETKSTPASAIQYEVGKDYRMQGHVYRFLGGNPRVRESWTLVQ